MLDLDKLWVKRIRVLLENVASDEEQHREIARTAEHIRADYHGRFLVELIQNAADQATAAGLTNARLLIVHRNGLLAVANAGAAFSDRGINSLTSLGLSPKKPDESIGNKGVGFKAVFEVTEAPELYGAANGRDLAEGVPNIRFRICADPFGAAKSLVRAEAMIAGVLAAEPTLRSRLAERFGKVPPPSAFLPHLQAAPPFKFPLELDEDAWPERLDQLGLRVEDLVGLESLILLPLIPKKATDVERALSDLTADTGALALFLPGVGTVEVARGDRRIEVKRAERRREQIGDGWFSHRETSVTEGESRAIRDWWFAERTVGDAPGELDAVRAAVGDLPGDGWAEVERIPVAVALPKPDSESLALPVDGKYVIGLPTLDTTGLAWWVNGHFHGTISRKAIDLDTNVLNKLILGSAAGLMRRLLDRLKVEPARPADPPLEHFAVALSLKGVDKHLWKAFTAAFDPFAAELVLAPTGDRFVAPNDLRLPESEDRGLVLLAAPDLRDPRLATIGLAMPHPRLLAAEGKSFLDITLPFAPVAAFLQPVGGMSSLLECWASENRHAGPPFWRPFLEWAVARLPSEIQGQAVMPTVGGGLTCPEVGVFLPLEEGDAHAPSASDLDGLPADALRFADPAALFDPKDAIGNAAFRKVLAGATPSLADEPHYLALLEDAVAGALEEAINHDDHQASGQLLTLAVRWISQIAPASDPRILSMPWRVPAADGSWPSATTTYLGDGWSRGADRSAEAVMAAVYGTSRILPEWRALRTRLGFREDDREAVRAAVLRMGVASKPRLLRLTTPVPAFRVAYQAPSEPIAALPWPGTTEIWARWLGWVRTQPFNWRRNTVWNATEATWLDGLEIPDAPEILGEWVLRHPDGYADATKATFRPDGINALEKTLAPWVHFLRSKNPRIVPTTSGSAGHGGLARVLEACVVPLDLRRKAGMGLLQIVADGVNDTLRTDLAVVAFPAPPAWWIIRTLKALAAGPLPRDSRGLEALVQRLWGRLNTGLGANPPQVLQDELFAGPVLVWKGKTVLPMLLTDAPTIYIDDDPFNTRYITGFDKEIVLRPSRAETAWANLAAVLASKLGADRVRRTGEIEPNVAFQSDEPVVSLIEWLERKTRLGGRLRVDLAALLWHSGRSPLADGLGRAKAAFRRLLSSRVQFGLLTTDVDAPSHWRRSACLLAVSRDIEAHPDRVFAETWPVVGEDWREAWSAFAHALAGGREGVERFFWERRIGEETRDEVRIEFGLDADRLRWLQPTLFAIWAAGQEDPKKAEFERQLADRRAEDWAEWLDTGELRNLVTAEDGEHKPEEYVPRCGVSWPSWQHGRRVLGMGDYRFPQAKEAFQRGVEHLAACVLALAASDATLDVSISQRLRASPIPPSLVLEPVDDVTLCLAWLGALRGVASPLAICDLLDPVAAAGSKVASTIPVGCNADVVGEYRDFDAGQRERRSSEFRSAAQLALSGLAVHRGAETVAPDFFDAAGIAAVLHGPLANRVLLRDRVAGALADAAPRAHSALLGAGLLAAGRYAFEFRLFADGLAPRIAPPRPPVQPAQSRIAGVTLPAVTSGAPVGAEQTAKLLAAMSAMVITPSELATFMAASAERQAVSPKLSGGGGGGGGGGPGRSAWRPPEENEDARRATGLGGELFVLQQFKALPGFDEECWKSSSRATAGLPDDGDDTLGYDFLYVDATGCVAQKPGVRCLIEVKASQGSADPTFPMSRNEWRVAGAAHVSEGDLYVIVRVENVANAARIADVLIDPFGMCGRGEIELAEKDLWVSVAAKRLAANAASETPAG